MNLFPGLTAWATVMPGLRPWNGVDTVDVVDEFTNSCVTAWATVMPRLRPWNGVDTVDAVDEFPNSCVTAGLPLCRACGHGTAWTQWTWWTNSLSCSLKWQ